MKTSTAGLGLLLFASLAFLPFRTSSQDVILQGFYWNTNPGDITDVNNGLWWDTITLVSPYLADLGFKTVWTPPATKGSGIYDMGYGTYDYYDFGDINQQFTTRTRHGSKAEMLAMIQALHDEGLLAMADLVLNHRGSANAQQLEDCDDGDGLQMRWTDFNPGSGRLHMDAWDFHPNFTHCDLNPPYHDRLFFEDLCYFNFLDQTLDPPTNDWYFGPHNLGRVGDSLIVWGRYLLDVIEFDELRLDAVKHIEPGFLAPFLVEMETPDQPFAVGELFDGNLGVLKGYHDEVEGFVSNYGIGSKDANLAIFDFNLRYALRDMCNNGGGGYNMWDLNTTGLRFNPSGGLDGEDIVTFVENHDVDRIGWQVVSCASPHQQQVGATCLALYTDGGHDPIVSDKEDMGYPYIMAAEGRPTVFWKDLFWYGLNDDISWQMALRDETASGDSDPIQDLAPFFSSGNGGDLFVLNRDGASGAANDGGMVLALNDHSSSEASVWVNTPFSDKYLKDYSDGYLFVSSQAFADSRANVKAQSRDYSWWSLTGLYPKPAGTAASHFQMDATPGGCPHFIALRVADAPNLLVNGAPIDVDDEVAVKNGNGDIVGIGRIGQDTRWDGVHDMIIEVLGTKSSNGMSNGEAFTFVVYDESAGMEFTIAQVQYAAVGNTFSFSPDRPDSPNRNGNFSTFNISASRQGLYSCEGISRVLAFDSTVEPLVEPCQAISQASASAYNDGLQSGDNDGAGFLAWTGMVPASNSGFAGYFVASSTGNGDGDSNGNGDIDSGGEAWGFYANTNNLSEGTRPFASPMTPGTTLYFKMDNGWLDDLSATGTVGFSLRNSSSQNLMEFYFVEGNTHYTINDATGSGANNSGIPFTDEGLQIEIQLLSLSSYQLKVTPIGGATTTFTRSLHSPGGGQVPDRVRFFNFSAGSGAQRNLYFNSLQLCELPALLINEVDYDQVSTDNMEFIELKNQSTVSINLDAYTLELVNGGDNTIYQTVNLPNTMLAPGDYYVICAIGSTVPNCDFNFTGGLTNKIENGAPDAVRLLWNTVTTDALSYEGSVTGAVEGSGIGLEDSNTIPEVGLSRVPDGADTDQNNIDFELTCITPGETNSNDNTDTDDDDSPDACDECPLAQNQGSIANFDIPNCACLPGYYAVTSVVNGQEVITGCQICPLGTYCPDGILAYPCQAGSFQDQPGQTSCIECVPGRFSSVMGSVFCTLCPAGKYQSEPGATECEDCPPGKYQSNTGAVFCQDCPVGSFTSMNAQIHCETCEPGSEAPFSGSVLCVDCTPPDFSSCPTVPAVNNDPGLCEANVIVPMPVLSDLCTRNHALDFDGVNDYVSLGAALLPTSANTAFTIEAWIRTTDGDGAIVSQYDAGSTQRFIFFIEGNKLKYWRGATTYAVSTASVNDGQWHHVAVTRTIAGNISLYIDGNLDGTGSDNSGFFNGSTLIGAILIAGTPNRPFTGEIDETRIWSTARSQTDIQAAMNLEINSSYPGLTAFYHFNEGIACCDNTGLDNLPDGMAGNDGTLIGFSLDTGCTSNWTAGAPALGDPLTLVNDWTNDCGDVSGTFPGGTTVVTWTATGANGATETCSISVTVTDNEPPTIDCPSDFSVSTDPGECAGLVNFAGGGSLTWTDDFINGFAPSNAQCQNWSDFLDLLTPASYASVTIKGTFDPVGITITDPVAATQLANLLYTETEGSVTSGGHTWNVYKGCVATSCVAQPDGIELVLDEGVCSCGGSYTIRPHIGNENWGGVNTSTCFAPSQTMTLEFTISGGGGPVTIDDNCPGAILSQTAGLPDGSVFPIGMTLNTFEVTDGVNPPVSCSFTVTVVDTEPPSIICPSDIFVDNDPGQCCAVVDYIAPMGTDNCPDPLTIQTEGQASGSCFPVGSTLNTFEVTDGAGLTASCSFWVNVTDVEPPSIDCPSDISVDNDPGLCCATVNYVAPAGTDNCPGQVTNQTAGQADGSCFPVGTTTNTFEVTDGVNPPATCSFTVTVSDTEPPALVCPADIVAATDPGGCTAIVNFADPTASDNCASGGLISQVFSFSGVEEVFVVPDGVYSIYLEAWGAQGGESHSCTGGPDPEFDGGLGGYAAGTLAVTPGQTLYINVGGKGLVGEDGTFDGGWNGGGDGGYWGGGGGGGSDVRTISGDLFSRLLVAGGGGGGNTGCSDHGAGGGGGGLVGEDGLSFNGWEIPTGGTQFGGGIGQNSGEYGSFGQGGNAPGGEYHVGGGGGGWYGGGSAFAAGGAGGSSYIGGVAGGTTNAAVQNGDGMVLISWLLIEQTEGLPSGSPFPFGTTTNIFETTDGAGNTGTCSFSVMVSGTPCDGGAISIIDPCTCLDNASTLADGQFSETIQVTSGPGETWTVVLAPGLYQMASLAPPAAPLPVAAGTPLVEGPAGIYTLAGKHVDALGYSISVTNGSVTLSTSNTCFYPNPSLSGLNEVYCSQDGPQVATVTAQLGDGSGPATVENILFELIRQSDNSVIDSQSGISNTFNFDPSGLAQGAYTLRATFDGADDGAGHPGCEQAVEEDFEVRKVGCGEFPWDGN